MFPEIFPDIDAIWAAVFCFHATKFFFIAAQGSCVQTAYGKDPWPMLNHKLCPGVFWDAAGWPGPKPCQGAHQQFGKVNS